MALSAKHRSRIYEQLSPMLGEEEAEALLSQFPSRDLDEPVTKEFVRAEIGDLRTELHDRLGDLGTELRTEIAELGTELRAEIGDLRTELHDRLREQTMWVAGALFAGMGAAAAIGSLVS